jgi:hypothetical protein
LICQFRQYKLQHIDIVPTLHQAIITCFYTSRKFGQVRASGVKTQKALCRTGWKIGRRPWLTKAHKSWSHDTKSALTNMATVRSS